MFGLAKDSLELVDPEQALGRVRYDVRSDFILAPHYSAVFAHAADELWEHVAHELESGQLQLALPIVVDVPKPSRLTRPGAILTPIDRVVYQALLDVIAPVAEDQLDRTRVFSYVLLKDDPECKMFEDPHSQRTQMMDALRELAADGSWGAAIKTDVANYYETLYQHNLINLLQASGCDAGAVNLLERLLLAWAQKASHGIIQGVFPSDFLGNFYLSSLDANLAIKGLPSVRYVDDLRVFTQDLDGARRALVDLCAYLRQEGIYLNESKTATVNPDELVEEETELDKRFEKARQEIIDSPWETAPSLYGFQSTWEIVKEGSASPEEEVKLLATEALYEGRKEAAAGRQEQIDRFCLPVFSAAQSTEAVEDALEGIVRRPHMSHVYCSYLASLMPGTPDLAAKFEKTVVFRQLPYDWQAMWCVGALLSAESVSPETVDESMRILVDGGRQPALRALCTGFAGKFGSPQQRRILRLRYSDEPSEYVRSAILFASRYFPTGERNTCISSWGGHSFTNSLIGKAVKVLAQGD